MRVMNAVPAVKGILLVAIGLSRQISNAQNASSVVSGDVVVAYDPSTVAVSNDHQSSYCPQPYLERWRVVTDLNCDGVDDVILSDTTDTFGNAGGGWMVYTNSNGYWRCIGDVGLHPGALTLDRVHDEVDLWYYSRCSAQEGHIGYYSFHAGAMGKPSSQMFIRTEGEDDNVFADVLNAVFGAGHRHPYHLDVSETTTNGVVLWKTMGDWRKPFREDVVSELKRRLAEAERRALTAEEKLKHVSWRLGIFERDLLDVSGVTLGSRWEGSEKSFVCAEVFHGFTNMTVRVDENGYVDGVVLVRELSGNESGIAGGRFPSDEEQRIIHQAENHFHVRFAIGRHPGTYIWENPFERVRVRIDFRDRTRCTIEAEYLKSFSE